MSQKLETTYNPKEIESKLYEKWCENKYFHAEVDRSRKPFTTVMPPPNITGKLHMGHALDNTLQDILIRYKRMQGYNALWVPGTDHAAISTEVKVTNQLKEEGIDKKELGREKFLERTWQWKEEWKLRQAGSAFTIMRCWLRRLRQGACPRKEWSSTWILSSMACRRTEESALAWSV